MVLPSCRSVSPPAPGVPNSSGTSVSATDQRIPRLRSHTRRSVKPTAAPQTTGPLFKYLSLVNLYRNNFLRLSKALCCSLWLSVNTATSANLPWFIFTGFKDNPSFPEEQPHSSFPEGSALDGRSCPQSPSLGRAGRLHQAPGPHSRDRQRILAATSEAPPSHTRPSHERQSVAGHLRATPYLRLSSVTIPLKGPDHLLRVPRYYLVSKTYFLARLG